MNNNNIFNCIINMIMTYILSMLTFTKTSLLVIEIIEVSFLYHPQHTKERNCPGQSRVKTKDS